MQMSIVLPEVHVERVILGHAWARNFGVIVTSPPGFERLGSKRVLGERMDLVELMRYPYRVLWRDLL